jgi:DNA polymerase
MKKLVNLDFETRSTIDIATHGLDKYAKCRTTKVLCMAYSINGGEVHLWTPNLGLPLWLTTNLKDIQFQAWNAAFEFHIMKYVLGWDVEWEQMTDSMAIAAANNIPQALEDAAIFLGTTQQKDTAGKRLITKLCKPNRKGQFVDDPVLLDQLYEYCKQDVRTEMDIVRNLQPLTPHEQSVWVLTQKINERGVPVDPDELRNAINAVESGKESINQASLAISGCKATETGKLLGWLNAKGADMANLTAEYVSAKLVDTNLDPDIRKVLELRQQGSQTSVAKYEKMLDVQVGGRIRNTLVYHGASTGRWASRGGLNLQNIARPTIDDNAIKNAVERVLEGGQGGTMEELSSLVRSAIKAPYGQVFIDVDFSSIENRVASWIAGQTDKVEMFREGLDEYKTFASTALYQVPYEEVTKDMRQIAKSAVLGCMFGQGAKGLMNYAQGMGVQLDEQQSQEAVNAYRLAYSKVKNCWYNCHDKAMQAINNPSETFELGKLLFKYANDALWMRLPSGRFICWRDPKIEAQLTPWGEMRDGVTVRSQNTFTRKWGRNALIGSSIFQSAVQGTARDVLAECSLLLEKEGFEIINLVHDEALLLAYEDKADIVLKQVLQIMTTAPTWAKDFPLAAEGWVDKRYRK